MNPKPKRRMRSKGWFCTWPKCDVSQEFCLSEIKRKHDLIEYVICKEDHADETKHLHAFFKVAKRIEFKSDLFDFAGYHGHYESAKSWRAVKQYVKKEGDYISNFNVSRALHKRSKQTISQRNSKLINTDIKELVDSGEISILTVPSLLKAKRLYYTSIKPPLNIKRHCFWIYGRPRVGKSHIVRVMFPDLYDKPQNKWWDLYMNERVVLIDDFDKQGECLGHHLKIWADDYRFVGEIKGGSIYIVNEILIVTSNYQIGDIFTDTEVRDALMCRFMCLNLLNRFGQDLIKRIILSSLDN